MVRSMLRMSIVAGVALGGASLAMADQSADLQARVSQLEAQLAQVQQSQSDAWLNERRAEEVKTLIRDVLSDADTRASLMQDGLTAGHDGKNFFLKSNDGAFVLKVAGQIQIRALWDLQDSRPDGDDDDFGFQIRRAKLIFSGNVPSSKIDYKIQLASDRDDGTVFVEDVIVGRAINDNWYVSVGKQKLPFLREELISSTRLLAVERGIVSEYFTLNRGEGVQLDYTNNDNFRASLSFNDGQNSETSDFGADGVELAFTARGDLKLMGDWKALDDQTAWKGQDDALFVGGAVHYELGDGNNGQNFDYFSWTLDASYENGGGLSLAAAVVGGHSDFDAGGDRDTYGVQLTGAYNIDDKWQPFVRYEWLDQDFGSDDKVHAITAGINRYVRGHNVKFTADVVYIFDGNYFGNLGTGGGVSGLGLTDDDDFLTVRGQVQVLF